MEYPLLVAADSGGASAGLRVMNGLSALDASYEIGMIDGRQMR